MFPLAQVLHKEGYYLTGSDNNESDILKMVRALGIPVTMGQKAENIEGADLIVHTAAIMEDNPELIAAKASGVPTIERSVLLGIITERLSLIHILRIKITQCKQKSKQQKLIC